MIFKKKKAPKKRFMYKRGLSRTTQVVISLFCILLLTGSSYLGYKVWEVRGEKIQTTVNEGVEEPTLSGIVNIAVFGIDSRGDSYNDTRSDANIVASIDFDNKKVTLSSIARDLYVKIPGRGYDKFAHAYFYGGAQLAVDTMNLNFDMNIKDYITVNFWAVERIIDRIDGITMNVKDYEINEINKYIRELNHVSPIGGTAKQLTKTGKQKLTGRQAVSYMRIRKVGNADYERMERQRRVLTTTIKSALTMDSVTLLAILNDCTPYIKTSLDLGEMVNLGTNMVTKGIDGFQQLQLPDSTLLRGGTFGGMYCMMPKTLKDNVIKWYEVVYGKEHEPSKTVVEISDYIYYTFLS